MTTYWENQEMDMVNKLKKSPEELFEEYFNKYYEKEAFEDEQEYKDFKKTCRSAFLAGYSSRN